jgi:hypothetical protein
MTRFTPLIITASAGTGKTYRLPWNMFASYLTILSCPASAWTESWCSPSPQGHR